MTPSPPAMYDDGVRGDLDDDDEEITDDDNDDDADPSIVDDDLGVVEDSL